MEQQKVFLVSSMQLQRNSEQKLRICYLCFTQFVMVFNQVFKSFKTYCREIFKNNTRIKNSLIFWNKRKVFEIQDFANNFNYYIEIIR